MISYEELAAENARLLGIMKALKEENAVLRSMLPPEAELQPKPIEPDSKPQPLDREAIIALPLQGMARRSGNSVFVDDNFAAYEDQSTSRARYKAGLCTARQIERSLERLHSHSGPTIKFQHNFLSGNPAPDPTGSGVISFC